METDMLVNGENNINGVDLNHKGDAGCRGDHRVRGEREEGH